MGDQDQHTEENSHGNEPENNGKQTGYKNPGQAWCSPPGSEIPFVPLEWHGDEPFLSTAVAGVTLTPFRDDEADAENLAALLNHPTVGQYSFDRPYPFTVADARAKIRAELPLPTLIDELKTPHAIVDVSPFSAIRLHDKLVGDIRVWLRPDGRNVFGLTYDLHPDYQRRGIVGAAVAALLGWAGRGMEASRVEAYAETRNVPSSALLRKLGFTVVNTVTIPWPAASGGGERELFVFQRALPTPAPAPAAAVAHIASD